MARAVALKPSPRSALAVIVRTSGRSVAVEAVVNVPLAEGDSPAAIGQKLAAALAPHSVGRAAAIFAVPRSDLHWQNYELPPAPVADLPDLVLLQAQRDIVLADDGVGFDYLSLHGDEEHPHRILAFGVTPSRLENARSVCAAADLKLQRMVPEPFGWMELGRRIADEVGATAAPMTVFAAIAGRQAAVWATQEDSLRLLRTVWLAPEPDPAADLAALAGELRRTLLSLSQMAGAPSATLPCVFVGANSDAVAAELSKSLGRAVRSVGLKSIIEFPDAFDGELTEAAPLAALAAATAADRPSPVDLLHPHRPPAPPSRKRQLGVLGAAAASVVALLAWTAYRQLQAPLEAAAKADAARAELKPTLDRFAKDEEQAAAVEAWLAQSPNLLTELDALGQLLRPRALDDKEFKADEDLMLTKLTLAGRQFTINAAAKSSDALQGIEQRLRAANYRVDRGVVEIKADAPQGYTASVTTVLEHLAGSAAPTNGAAEAKP
jgi:hypothetical protein